MLHTLPASHTLKAMYALQPDTAGFDTATLQRVFAATTNSYKYYWLWAIVELVLERTATQVLTTAEQPSDIQRNSAKKTYADRESSLTSDTVLSSNDILMRVLQLAWTPIIRYRLSLGTTDKLGRLITRIHNTGDRSVRFHDSQKIQQLIHEWFALNYSGEYHRLLKYVPYRFLTPFFQKQLTGRKDHDKNSIIQRCSVSPISPYRIENVQNGIPERIIISPDFTRYIRRNPAVHTGWIKYHLLEYLQRRNASAPALVHKLEASLLGRNLSAQRKIWSQFMADHTIIDLYADTEVHTSAYDIDHYIPWSFIQHNQYWNLIPSHPNGNRSKSDSLPDWDRTFSQFADYQYQFYDWCRLQKAVKPLEDYIPLLKGERAISHHSFTQRLMEHTSPLYQIAQQYGY